MSVFIWIMAILLAGVFLLWWKGYLKKIPSLSSFRIPRFPLPPFLRPSTDTVVERLYNRLEKEEAKGEELEKVLRARTALASQQAKNRGLRRQIERVSPEAVESAPSVDSSPPKGGKLSRS